MKPASKPLNATGTRRQPNQLRVIGGRWRGTKLNFPPIAAIRPTPDRVRETLFNWLQTDIVNARCLDLFAGSGAIGLEALSRGASNVTFVDRETAIGKYLHETLQRLQCDQAEVQVMDAVNFLKGPATPFDIVFLDPPFVASAEQELLSLLCVRLENHGWLNSHAWLYIESPSSMGSLDKIPQWPRNWTVHRSKQAGQVGYHLVKRSIITTQGVEHDQSTVSRYL